MKYVPLGAYRFLLALCVFCAHTVTIFNPAPRLPMELAKLGVWGFFVVSGYIVMRAAEEHYVGRPGAFIANRALRILPAFLASYVFAWGALLLVGPTADPGVPPGISIAGLGLREFLLGASILGSWSDANVFAPNPPAWSIFVEAVFYLAMALALLARHRAAFAVGALVMFFVPPVSAHLGPLTLLNVSGPFKYAPLFVLGSAIFAVQQRATVAAIATLVASGLLTIGSVFGLQHMLYRPEPFDSALVYNALGLVALVLVMTWLSSLTATRWAKLDKALGDLTYPLYLVHVPVLALIWVSRHERTAANWLLSLATCLAVSWLVVRFIEVPVSVFRGRVRARTERHPTHTPESSPARS